MNAYLVRESHRVPRTRHANRLEHAAVSELLHDPYPRHLVGLGVVVRFDAPDVVRPRIPVTSQTATEPIRLDDGCSSSTLKKQPASPPSKIPFSHCIYCMRIYIWYIFGEKQTADGLQKKRKTGVPCPDFFVVVDDPGHECRGPCCNRRRPSLRFHLPFSPAPRPPDNVYEVTPKEHATCAPPRTHVLNSSPSTCTARATRRTSLIMSMRSDPARYLPARYLSSHVSSCPLYSRSATYRPRHLQPT